MTRKVRQTGCERFRAPPPSLPPSSYYYCVPLSSDTVTIASQGDLEAALRFQASRQLFSPTASTVSLGGTVAPGGTATAPLGVTRSISSGGPVSLRIVLRKADEGIERSHSVSEMPVGRGTPGLGATGGATPTIAEETSQDLEDSTITARSSRPAPEKPTKKPIVLQDFDLSGGGGGGGGGSSPRSYDFSTSGVSRSPRWRNHNSESKFADTAPSPVIGRVTAWKRGSMIGSGSYGRVYVALDQNTGTQIAVKCVNFGEDMKSKQEVAALKREIDLLSNLNHPNIIKYLGTATRHRKLYIFLEYASGGSVMSAIKR